MLHFNLVNFLFFFYLFPSYVVLLDNLFVFIEDLLEYTLQYFTKYFFFLLNRRNIILQVLNFANFFIFSYIVLLDNFFVLKYSFVRIETVIPPQLYLLGFLYLLI